MLSGHRSAGRRRGNSRAARIAVPLAIPMVLGLTLGIILAVSSGNTTKIAQSALGASASPSASASGAGAAAVASAAPSATAAAAAMNCTISVPANPLTAQGLATPWQLGDGCSWADGATEGAFVEATILAPNGKVKIYDPLVVNQGTQPAVAPTPPSISGGSQVIISL